MLAGKPANLEEIFATATSLLAAHALADLGLGIDRNPGDALASTISLTARGGMPLA